MKELLLFLSLVFVATSYSQSISSITPDDAEDGETLSVSISGVNTHFAQATNTVVSFYFDSGTSTVTAPNSVDINYNENLTAEITVPAGTYQGSYGFTVFNELDGCLTAPSSFTVDGPPAPEIVNVSPSQLTPGGTFNVQISGNNTSFTQSSTNEVYFMFSQATNTLTMANNVVVSNDELLSADIEVPSGAYGGDYDVLVYNDVDGYRWLEEGVSVNGPTAPSITGITPSSGNIGGTYTITMTGNNTLFTQGFNGATFFTTSTNTCYLGGIGGRTNQNIKHPWFSPSEDIMLSSIEPDNINVINDELLEVTVTFPHGEIHGSVYFDLFNTEQGYVKNPYTFSLVNEELKLTEASMEFNVFPNPFTNEVNLVSKDFEGKNIDYELISSTGKSLKRGMINVNKGENKLNLENNLPQGIYYLRVHSENGETAVKKLIKQ